MPQKREFPSDEKLILSKAEDAVRMCLKQRTVKSVGFLTPAERSAIMTNLREEADVKTFFAGGYEDAERTIFMCCPDFMDTDDVLPPIVPVEITGSGIDALSHRDFLGSVLGLGIKREVIGDILPMEDRCVMFVHENIYEYISANLERIGKYRVNVRALDLSENITPSREVKEIFGTVASPRLDAVLSLALGISRANAAELIKAGRVFVNWKIALKTDFELKAEDMISARGFGRIKVAEVGGLSRKGRFKINLERYL